MRFQVEDGALQCDLQRCGLAVVHPEELEVAAEIENIELAFILTVHQTRAQTGTAADHLPELGLAHYLLEEHQIQTLRHVDAGVQHVHRNGDLGQLFGIGELVNQALGIVDPVVDHLGKAGQVGIFPVENLVDLFGVAVVLGEDNGLAQPLTVVDL